MGQTVAKSASMHFLLLPIRLTNVGLWLAKASPSRLPHDFTTVGSKSFAYTPCGKKTTRIPARCVLNPQNHYPSSHYYLLPIIEQCHVSIVVKMRSFGGLLHIRR